MKVRILLALALAAFALPAAAAPVQLLGAPVFRGMPLLLAGAAPADASPATSLDRPAIFAILCGGAPASDPQLRAHLWKVAGSLAARPWTPPRVTVRVVSTPAK